MKTIEKIMKQEKRRKKIRAAIVDDDPDIVDDLKTYVDLSTGVECVYATTNPKEALVALRSLKLDVLFLDIEMPIVSGLDILGQLAGLKRINPGIAGLQVVVCSTNREVGDKMFHYEVTDYFLKPFEGDRFYKAMDKVIAKLQKYGLNDLDDGNKCFFYGARGQEKRRLNYDEIIYIEAKDDQTWIWTDEKVYIEVNVTFGDMILWLPKANFAQVHRSFAVSLNHITAITAAYVILSGIEIKRGEKGKYKYFDQWIEQNTITGRLNRHGIVRDTAEKWENKQTEK
ncbi:LytTR family DNA-binding domain-containing protein [Sphingobacterium sp. DR205]|uniref:LytR/AlgR family response regulator transcription factor n=1 Tax=Sphingobacterium sp. DR205 TaxID=2713573 RepID=UPI0013E4F329|nr:LytTR family DNA-binding domain-containing protein [Sphingobacterium sp. DR205]QIH35715.1 response regulator transcription factor [Sphingobacterium sp. DR205]